MKKGDIVDFRSKRYSVGACMTKTSIELIELKDASKGLWVSRDEVHDITQIPCRPSHRVRRSRVHPSEA